MSRIRTNTTRAFAAAALALGVSVAAEAQQRDTSRSRIPVRKDVPRDTIVRTTSPGAVVTPAPVPVPRDTVTTTTTVTTPVETPVVVEQPVVRLGNWYFALGGGGSMPQADYEDIMSNGWNVTGALGWESPTNPLGFRLDVAYDKHMGEERTFGTGGSAITTRFDDASVWSGTGNLTLGFPLSRTSTWRPRLYLLGGGGVYHFGDLGDVASGSGGSGTEFDFDANSSTDWGVQGGAGLSFGIGRADLFVESRYVNVFRDRDDVQFVPVILGFKFR